MFVGFETRAVGWHVFCYFRCILLTFFERCRWNGDPGLEDGEVRGRVGVGGRGWEVKKSRDSRVLTIPRTLLFPLWLHVCA